MSGSISGESDDFNRGFDKGYNDGYEQGAQFANDEDVKQSRHRESRMMAMLCAATACSGNNTKPGYIKDLADQLLDWIEVPK